MGKVSLQVFGFLCLLILFTYVITVRVGITKPVGWGEIALWVCALGFILNEIYQCQYMGVKSYLNDGWNRADMVIYSCFVGTFIFRIVSPWENPEDMAVKNWQQLFDCTLALISFMLWSRLTFMFQLQHTLGPLLRMMACFIDDIVNFAFLLLGESGSPCHYRLNLHSSLKDTT